MRSETDASTHGFLFADLRGYTAYVERHGARAAAELLARYRTLVRAAVAAQGGAEIRTEGDSFYVVLPSASAAVDCALEIVSRAADSGAGAGTPIQVGVGVHAGESIQTAEGPVGSAVNIAARLCALAGPGQVLVSDTVRSLTRSVGSASYTTMGRKRLKGVDEPVGVYRATREAGSAGSSWRLRGPHRAAVPVAAAGVAGIALLFAIWRPWGSGVAVNPSDSAGPSSPASIVASVASVSPTGSPSPSREPGTFASDEFALPFTIDLGRRWQSEGETADVAAYFHSVEPMGWIDVVLVAAVLEPPCVETVPEFVGESPEDLIGWLTTRTWVDASAPRPYNIGPYLGRSVDLLVLENASAECDVRTDEVTFFRLGGSDVAAGFGATWGTVIGERKRVIAIDVNGRTVTVVVGSPFEDVERFWALSEPALQTLRFSGD
jgi:class 3 adenylate cyclase